MARSSDRKRIQIRRTSGKYKIIRVFSHYTISLDSRFIDSSLTYAIARQRAKALASQI